ncbi:unnamed protein product [Prunus brigantina]
MEKVVDACGTKLKRKGTVTCTKCWQQGHNKSNCANQPQDPPPGTYIDKRCSGATNVANTSSPMPTPRQKLPEFAGAQMETFLRMLNLGLVRYDASHVGGVLGSSDLVTAKELHN